MSLESDARDCLHAAIASVNHVDEPPDQWGSVHPSDPEIGAQNGTAWKHTLDVAAQCLRGKGYHTGNPDLGRANSLVSDVVLSSQAYLEELSATTISGRSRSTPEPKGRHWLVAGGIALAVGAAALLVHQLTRVRR